MKKVIKLIVPFLVAISAVTLAGCSNNGGSTTSSSSTPVGPIDPGELVEVSSISLNRANVALALIKNATTGVLEGETFQLVSSTLPRTAIKAKLTYSSSDATVASVNADGLITALKAGEATITAKSYDEKVTKTCRVFVYETLSKSKANKVVQGIKAKQTEQSIASNLDKIYLQEKFDSYLLKDGVLQNEDVYDQYMYVGKNDAYLRIGAKQEKEIKTEGGSASFTDWEWVFYTNASYDTYIFHILGNTKTYMVADSTSYVGKSRFTALSSILDSFFTSGSAIVTNQYTDVIGSDELGYVTSAKKNGSNKDGELFSSMSATYKNQTADIDDENNYYIPAETKYDINISIDSIFQDNVMYGKKLIQEMIYQKDGATYNKVYDIEDQYQIKDVEFFYPNKTEYVQVDSIFDL